MMYDLPKIQEVPADQRIIQGQVAQSINEWNVYLALIKLRVDFSYQYNVDGGRGVRGGQVVDFACWVPPKPVAIFVQGKYWHKTSTATEDQIKQARMEQLGFEVTPLTEDETMTPDLAFAAVRGKI